MELKIKKIIFDTSNTEIKGTDSISSLINKFVKQQYSKAVYYIDNYFRDTYIIGGKKYRIGKEATFKNLYIENVD